MLGTIDFIAMGAWIVVIVIALIFFGVLFWKYLKCENKTNSQIAFCIIFLAFALARAIFFYGDYFVVDLVLDDYIHHMPLLKLANLCNLLSLGFLIIVSEYAVFKGKNYYIFTVGFLIVFIISMAVQDYYQVQLFAGLAFYFSIFIPISWVYLGVKLPAARRNALFIFTGFLVLGAGMILVSVGITESFALTLSELYLISAALQAAGLLIMGLGVKRFYFPE